jgi:hypothetical protein
MLSSSDLLSSYRKLHSSDSLVEPGKDRENNGCKDIFRFMLTQEDVKQLQAEGFPEKVFTDLAPLEFEKFDTKTLFLKAVRGHIGEMQAEQHQEIILEYATELKPCIRQAIQKTDIEKRIRRYEQEEKALEQLYQKTDVRALIDIASEEDVLKKRNALKKVIWGNVEPSFHPLKFQIVEHIGDERFDRVKNLKAIDKIEITMDYSLTSIVYLFHPKKSNQQLLLYHEGHTDIGFYNGYATIAFFVEKGYTVLAFSMPLLGLNSQPEIYTERFGLIKLHSEAGIRHNKMMFLERPIRFFMEPIIVSLNFMEQQYRFDRISMVGLSGGGWTTTLAAAIEPRIAKSFPVAGTSPFFLSKNVGDFEQRYLELYRIANYLELYVLGAYGENRQQVQILNRYDPIFHFSGEKYKFYETIIADIVYELGKGSFSVFSDDTHHEHLISEYALHFIHTELEH